MFCFSLSFHSSFLFYVSIFLTFCLPFWHIFISSFRCGMFCDLLSRSMQFGRWVLLTAASLGRHGGNQFPSYILTARRYRYSYNLKTDIFAENTLIFVLQEGNLGSLKQSVKRIQPTLHRDALSRRSEQQAACALGCTAFCSRSCDKQSRTSLLPSSPLVYTGQQSHWTRAPSQVPLGHAQLPLQWLGISEALSTTRKRP
jgi:hypothetical protein